MFFVMAAAIGAYSEIGVLEVPLRVGLLAMGSLLAYLMAFGYSLYILRLEKPEPVPQLPPASFDFVVFDPVIIGASWHCRCSSPSCCSWSAPTGCR
jgi:hypothetical protein